MNSFEEQRITIKHQNEDTGLNGTVRLTTGEGCSDRCVLIEINPPHEGLAQVFVDVPLAELLQAVEALAKR